MKIVFYGLTISSSWGNGHATTYRSLCGALSRRGHQVHFIEKDVEWYRNNRDLPDPEFCKLQLYENWNDSASILLRMSKDADVVVVGSYFPDAIKATRILLEAGYGSLLFYDIDTPITLAELSATAGQSTLMRRLFPATPRISVLPAALPCAYWRTSSVRLRLWAFTARSIQVCIDALLCRIGIAAISAISAPMPRTASPNSCIISMGPRDCCPMQTSW